MPRRKNKAAANKKSKDIISEEERIKYLEHLTSKVLNKDNVKLDCHGDPILLSDKQRKISAKANNGVAWVAPADMPDEMVIGVKNRKYCGHRIVKDGRISYCKKSPISAAVGPIPTPCKFHSPGGISRASTEKAIARIQKKNQTKAKSQWMKYGLYTSCIRPEEVEMYEAIQVSAVDEEIKITKLRLLRALEAENVGQELIDEVVTEIKETEEGSSTFTRKKFRGASDAVNTIILQLSRLYAQKVSLETTLDVDSVDGTHLHVYLPANNRSEENTEPEDSIPESDIIEEED